jgi:hypothetical protein
MRTAFADQRRCWFGGGTTSSNPLSSSGESDNPSASNWTEASSRSIIPIAQTSRSATAGLDLIYHGGWANEDDLDIRLE